MNEVYVWSRSSIMLTDGLERMPWILAKTQANKQQTHELMRHPLVFICQT